MISGCLSDPKQIPKTHPNPHKKKQEKYKNLPLLSFCQNKLKSFPLSYSHSIVAGGLPETS